MAEETKKRRNGEHVNLEQSKWANEENLRLVEKYLNLEPGVLQDFYHELDEASDFLGMLEEKRLEARARGFNKGIFRRSLLDSADWFGFERVLIYVLIRHFRPSIVWETGVYYGGNSAFALEALHQNQAGELWSAELRAAGPEAQGVDRHPWVHDSEEYDVEALQPGFLVPDYLRNSWKLHIGSGADLLENFPSPCDFFVHDSDHAMENLLEELDVFRSKASENSVAIVDDVDWGNAFYHFVSREGLYPLLLTDNGKDGLRVRTGVFQTGHHFNLLPKVAAPTR